MKCQINTSNGIRDIIKNGKTLIKGINRSGIYHIITTHELNLTKTCDTLTLDQTKLWHNRMGHIGSKGLNFLFKMGVINKKPSDLDMCEDCILGKKTNAPFPMSNYKAKNPLE
ncbi:uncharacterized protein [Phyllobates terribilis]|uniref:uncharacterized protein n=1 Tax=Phyllobates terribilis TaxID=111132 RepID=UPI003CCAA8F1